jgi:hypothetical protein
MLLKLKNGAYMYLFKRAVFLLMAIISFKISAQTNNNIVIQPYFNLPGFNGRADRTVETRWIEAINQAVAGSKIHVSMYIINQRSVSEALVLAAARGVDVQLVLDGRNSKYKPNDAIDVLLNGFGGHAGLNSCSEKPCVKFCRGPFSFIGIKGGMIGNSCNGLVINHNKFMLFSKLSTGAEYVVMQSSANVEEEHAHRYNDLLEVQNDKKLYDGYLNYLAILKRDNTFIFKKPGDFVGDSGIIVRTSPRLIGKDPVEDLLKRVSCKLPGSIIRAAYSDLGRVGAARQLARLKSEGCKVQVYALYNKALKQPGKKVVKALGDSMIVWEDGSQIGKNSIHTKMLLIDAAFDGKEQKSKVVLTGSQNLDIWSLKTNDECQMEIRNDAIFEQYLNFWGTILNDAQTGGLRVFDETDIETKLQ